MSAMHAMALPEDDPDRQAAAICRFHGRTVRGRAVRGPVAVSETARAAAPSGVTTPANRAASSGAVASRTVRSDTPPDRATTAAPLRLTRRGRAVIAAAAALLVVMVSLIAASAAQATSHSVPPRTAEQNLSRVVVRPGQTLWSVAESADPGADTRLVIQQIVELNGLTSDVVLAGQRLWVPRG
jgi:LysM repeat protein